MTFSLSEADHNHILEKTVGLWEPLRGERVFITGGTGFVGTWMLAAFCAANRTHNLGASAIVLTRNARHFQERAPQIARDEAISLLEGDVTDVAFPSGTCSFIVHAATERLVPQTPGAPLSIVDRDSAATRHILELARATNAKRFLFTSSGAVYGEHQHDPISEEYTGAPVTTRESAAYGESKRLSEFACTSYGRVFSFDAIVARLFAFVGPLLPLDEGYAVGNFIGDVLAQRPITIGGDGTPLRSYLYAADLAIWLWTMLLKGEAGRAYNVGSSASVSIRELADTVRTTLSPATSVTVAREATPGATPKSYVPDTSRAERELGLHAWIDLPEGLRRTHAFYSTTRRPTTLK